MAWERVYDIANIVIDAGPVAGVKKWQAWIRDNRGLVPVHYMPGMDNLFPSFTEALATALDLAAEHEPR